MTRLIVCFSSSSMTRLVACFSSSEPVVASSDCSWFAIQPKLCLCPSASTNTAWAGRTGEQQHKARPQELGNWISRQNLRLSSGIAFGSDCQMTCRGSNLDSNLNSAAWPMGFICSKVFRSVENAEIEDSCASIPTLIHQTECYHSCDTEFWECQKAFIPEEFWPKFPGISDKNTRFTVFFIEIVWKLCSWLEWCPIKAKILSFQALQQSSKTAIGIGR